MLEICVVCSIYIYFLRHQKNNDYEIYFRDQKVMSNVGNNSNERVEPVVLLSIFNICFQITAVGNFQSVVFLLVDL